MRAEAWKATACDALTFWRRSGDRVVVRVCRSSDGRANEAIVTGVEGRDEENQLDSAQGNEVENLGSPIRYVSPVLGQVIG